MKSLKLLSTGTLFVFCVFLVQARRSSSHTDKENYSKIEFTNLETDDTSGTNRNVSSAQYQYRYNFGTIVKEPHKKITLDGSICYTNPSDIPLVISDVVPSCGCTSLESGQDWTRTPLTKDMDERCIKFKIQVEDHQYTLVKRINITSNANPEEISIPIIARFTTKEKAENEKSENEEEDQDYKDNGYY